jgi:hypothetical protein
MRHWEIRCNRRGAKARGSVWIVDLSERCPKHPPCCASPPIRPSALPASVRRNPCNGWAGYCGGGCWTVDYLRLIAIVRVQSLPTCSRVTSTPRCRSSGVIRRSSLESRFAWRGIAWRSSGKLNARSRISSCNSKMVPLQLPLLCQQLKHAPHLIVLHRPPPSA